MQYIFIFIIFCKKRIDFLPPALKMTASKRHERTRCPRIKHCKSTPFLSWKVVDLSQKTETSNWHLPNQHQWWFSRFPNFSFLLHFLSLLLHFLFLLLLRLVWFAIDLSSSHFLFTSCNAVPHRRALALPLALPLLGDIDEETKYKECLFSLANLFYSSAWLVAKHGKRFFLSLPLLCSSQVSASHPFQLAPFVDPALRGISTLKYQYLLLIQLRGPVFSSFEQTREDYACAWARVIVHSTPCGWESML